MVAPAFVPEFEVRPVEQWVKLMRGLMNQVVGDIYHVVLRNLKHSVGVIDPPL
jgi:hypothetical protein